jgi:hypothetical protein
MRTPRNTHVMASARREFTARDPRPSVEAGTAPGAGTKASPAHRRRVRRHEIGVVQRELRRLRSEYRERGDRTAV